MKNLILFLVLSVVSTLNGYGQKLTVPPADFPVNYVVKEWHPSYFKGTHVFYKDKRFLFIQGGIEENRKEFDYGTWYIEEGTITVSVDLTVGIRPVGKVLNPDVYHASNPDDYLIFEDYVNFEKRESRSYIIKPEEFIWEDCYIDLAESADSLVVNLEEYKINGDFKIASCKKLQSSDLESMTKSELRIMRNEIFARYGYMFKSSDLRIHFNNYSWYEGTRGNVDVFLTDIELANISLIKTFEK